MEWKLLDTVIETPNKRFQQVYFQDGGYTQTTDIGTLGFAEVYKEGEYWRTRHYAIRTQDRRKNYIGPETSKDYWTDGMIKQIPEFLRDCHKEQTRKADHQELISVLGKIVTSIDMLAKYVIYQQDRIEVKKFAEDVEKNGIKPITVD